MREVLETMEVLGEKAYRIENESLRLTVVPAWGGKVVSLFHKPTGVELLRAPASREEHGATPMLYGIPVLFPPNRIEGGAFAFAGRRYRFERNEAGGNNHIHGLVRGRGWTVEAAGRADGSPYMTLLFDGSRQPGVMAQFPHPFRLELRLALEGDRFVQALKVINDGDAAFPWGLGYHTAFRFPFGAASDPARCTISAPVSKRWELNERLLPTGRLADDPRCGLLQRGMPAAGVLLDDLFLVDAALPNEVTLADPDAGIRATYRADAAFRHWILHNGDGTGGYLCPEPYTCVTNAFNLDMDAALSGVQTLEPGECREVSCAIDVARL